ncbi:uncharacterized protein LOC130702911 [Daphnia carinata]|uniref:uncharacterized protein LOC130702911 n=1 Tax=Daphnia carinata TaxID=120202 RepID=UPI0025807248|nr:uncharacterized protein LOC130702911 [Daphnia carinata]
MVCSVIVFAALMQLAVGDVYYPPPPTPAPVTTTTTTTMATTTTTLPPDVITTVPPVILMNALMDNVRQFMSMYPPVPYVNGPAGYPVPPAGYPVPPANYPPMGIPYYEATTPVAPPMPVYNNYAAPIYAGMPSAPVHYGPTGYGSGYVTTARSSPYSVLNNNYGSSYGSYGPSNIYGIGSRPTANTYYGGGYQQQMPYNYNNAGYYSQPSYPMNIAYHGPAW